MKLSSNDNCVVVLTRKDVTVNFNEENEITFKANHMMLISCENNVIDFSELEPSSVLHLNRDVIKTISIFKRHQPSVSQSTLCTVFYD